MNTGHSPYTLLAWYPKVMSSVSITTSMPSCGAVRLLYLVIISLCGISCVAAVSTDYYATPSGGQRPDIVIGSLVDIHEWNTTSNTCSSTQRFDSFLWVETIRYGAMQINQDPTLLPGLTLGVEFHDVCGNEARTLTTALTYITPSSVCNIANSSAITSSGTSLTSGQSVMTSSLPPLVPLVLGPSDDVETLAVAILLSTFGIPLMSYRATDMRLSDECRFNLFSRTIPSDVATIIMILEMFQRFGWNYITAVHTADESSQFFIRELVKQARAQDPPICVITSNDLIINERSFSPSTLDQVVSDLKKTTSVAAPNNIVFLRIRGSDRLVREFFDAVLRGTPQNATEPLFRFVADDTVATLIEQDPLYKRALDYGIGYGSSFPVFSQSGSLEQHFRDVALGRTSTDNPWWNPQSERVRDAFEDDFTFIIDPISVLALDAIQAAAYALNYTLSRLVAQSNGQYSTMAALVRDYRLHGRRLSGRDFQQGLQSIQFRSWSTNLTVSFNKRGDLRSFNIDIFSLDLTGMYGEAAFETSDSELPKTDSCTPSTTGNNCPSYVSSTSSLATLPPRCLTLLDISGAVEVGLRTFRYAGSSDSQSIILQALHVGNSSMTWFNAVCNAPCGVGKYPIFRELPCCWQCQECPEYSVANGSMSLSCSACPAGAVPNSNRSACVLTPLRHHWNTGAVRFVVMGIGAVGFLATVAMLLLTCYFNRRVYTINWSMQTCDMTVFSLVGMATSYLVAFVQIQKPNDVICGLVAPLHGLTLVVALCPLLVVSLHRWAHFADLEAKAQQESSSQFTSQPPSSYQSVFGSDLAPGAVDAPDARQPRPTTPPPADPLLESHGSGQLHTFAAAADRCGGSLPLRSAPVQPDSTSTERRHPSVSSFFGDVGTRISERLNHLRSSSSAESSKSMFSRPFERLLFCYTVIGLYVALQAMTLTIARSSSQIRVDAHSNRYLACAKPSLSVATTMLNILLLVVTVPLNIRNMVFVRRVKVVTSTFDIKSLFTCFLLLIFFLVDLLLLPSVQTEIIALSLYPVIAMVMLTTILHLPVFLAQSRKSWLAKHRPEQLAAEIERDEMIRGRPSAQPLPQYSVPPPSLAVGEFQMTNLQSSPRNPRHDNGCQGSQPAPSAQSTRATPNTSPIAVSEFQMTNLQSSPHNPRHDNGCQGSRPAPSAQPTGTTPNTSPETVSPATLTSPTRTAAKDGNSAKPPIPVILVSDCHDNNDGQRSASTHYDRFGQVTPIVAGHVTSSPVVPDMEDGDRRERQWGLYPGRQAPRPKFALLETSV